MTWKIFEKIIEAPSALEVRLAVDPLIPAVAWGMHEYCGTEVLFYVRKTVEEDYREEDGRGVLTLYLAAPEPARDIHVPRQKASEYDVEVADPPPLEYGYAVVHTHPRGVTRFSGVDKEYINVNHPVSVLVESGRVADAVVSLGLGGVVVEARPRLVEVEWRLLVEAVLPGGRRLTYTLPRAQLLKAYASHLIRGPLREQLSRVEGCRRGRR